MSNNIDLKGGLNIPISGTAAQKTKKTVVPDVIAVKPTDFKGLIPRLLVKEGDKVLAGSPVLADKKNPDILFTSPVSGTVTEIVRGEKRKLLEVRIKADAQQEFVDFGVHKPSEMAAADIKALLLQSGLWPSLIQRPYGILADPAISPKAIFVSAFTTAPLAAVPEFDSRMKSQTSRPVSMLSANLRTAAYISRFAATITPAPRSTRSRTLSSMCSAENILQAM